MAAGTLLAEYRKTRRLSQLELGLRADVSARHVSFMETGRARPSREMLLRLAEALDLPHRDANILLAAGGYTPVYSQANLDAPEMRPVREALEIMLHNQEPFPATVVDGCFNVLMANRVQLGLFAMLFPDGPPSRGPPSGRLNVLELLFDPSGFRPLVANWNAVAGWMLRRLRRELAAFPQPALQALYERLLDMEPPADWEQPTGEPEGPMLTVDLVLQGQSLRMFSTLSRFGTALDVGAEELLVESYFPADEATRVFFMQMQA